MILDTGKKQYRIVREVLGGEKNDVFVAQTADMSIVSYKTLWKIKDKEMAKFLLREFCREDSGTVYEECFMIGENMFFSFPYYPERPLLHFYKSTVGAKLAAPEKIWKEFVVRCMSGRIPDVLMHLIFEQGQVQLSSDGSIYFNYFLDLSMLDIFIRTKDCVMDCAGMLCTLIQMTPGKTDIGVKLLDRRLKKEEYTGYLELYQDVRLIMGDKDRDEKVKRKRLHFIKKDTLFRLSSVVCLILLFIVILMILSQILFDDVVFFRLFFGPLKQIGTESLLQ